MTRPPRRRSPLLVVLEGIDGVGKSTLARNLARRWRARGVRVVRRREPRDARLGRAAVRLARSDPWAAAMLFTLDRAARTEDRDVAGPRVVVLQDRSYLSTLAYQGHALPRPEFLRLRRLEERVAPRAAAVVWLDLPPAVALARVRRRGRPRAAIERALFLRKVRSAYAGLSKDRRWLRFDATAAPGPLADQVDRALADRFSRLRGRAPRRR